MTSTTAHNHPPHLPHPSQNKNNQNKHSLSHLLPPTYTHLITAWLAEDCPSFDYAGFVVGDAAGEARLLGKSAGILAGVPFFEEVFRQCGCL